MSISSIKSSPKNRINAIHNALLAAHEDAQVRSHSSLHKMPEFFMAIRVADYFADHFLNFGYRLEAQVKRTFERADLRHQDIEQLLNDPEVRSNGRFDLVLRTGKKGLPAHVLEFKKGIKIEPLLKDVRRLAKICEHAGRERLKTNYLVFTKRCPANSHTEELDATRLEEELKAFKGVTCKISATPRMSPLLTRDFDVVEGGAFQVVVIEIKAKD